MKRTPTLSDGFLLVTASFLAAACVSLQAQTTTTATPPSVEYETGSTALITTCPWAELAGRSPYLRQKGEPAAPELQGTSARRDGCRPRPQTAGGATDVLFGDDDRPDPDGKKMPAEVSLGQEFMYELTPTRHRLCGQRGRHRPYSRRGDLRPQRTGRRGPGRSARLALGRHAAGRVAPDQGLASGG